METGKNLPPEMKGSDAMIILQISSTTQESKNRHQVNSSSNLELAELDNSSLKCRVQTPAFANSPSTEIAMLTPSKGSPVSRKPPFSSQIPRPYDATSPVVNFRSEPATPRSPLLASPVADDDDDDDEVYKTLGTQKCKYLGMKWKGKLICIELVASVCNFGVLISSLTVDRLHNFQIWDLPIWKWCELILSIFCGRLLAECFMCILVLLIQRKVLLKKDILYYAYGLKKSVQTFIWLSLVLLVWGLLILRGVKRSRHTTKILNYVTRFLAACLVGIAIWVLKTFFVKLLAASFYISKFFDRIQQSISHQYVFNAIFAPRLLSTLSGPPLLEIAEMVGRTGTMSDRLNFTIEEAIDVNKIKKMKHGKVSAWTMQGLINVITNTRLSVLSNTLDEIYGEQEINSEWEAKAAAYRIFRNIAPPGSKYIDEEDLLRFMIKEEVDLLFSVIEDAETRRIKRSALRNWLVNIYRDRKSLVKSLKGSMAAIENLNRLASLVMLVVIIIVWLLVMGFLTFQVLVVILSQFILVSFMFGNTAKSVFEAVIFVFVIHPFDVGNQCNIDGEQMIVDEINILTTVFVKQDGKKVYYPNSVLISKPITNFYGSLEIRDAVEFDVSTSTETVQALKEKVKEYLENNYKYWHPEHTIQIKRIEDEHKMSMVLYVDHKIDIHNSGEKNKRRSKLVEDLRRIFEDLGIKCHLLL
eukprot:XP_015571649.1 mechanosensitive ion channel protein 10-like [Ricinus communis]